MTLANGTVVNTPFSPGPGGLQPYSAMVLQGPKNLQSDVSLYKEFSIAERWKLQFDVDAINAFNIWGPGESDYFGWHPAVTAVVSDSAAGPAHGTADVLTIGFAMRPGQRRGTLR
jgi:hypothetical protein